MPVADAACVPATGPVGAPVFLSHFFTPRLMSNLPLSRRPRPHARLGIVIIPAVAIATALFAHAQSNTPVTKLEGGLSYSRGDYGLSEDTEVWVAPFNVVHETTNWRTRLTLPWLNLRGPAAVIANGGAGGPVRPSSSSASGLGDSMLTLTYKPTVAPDAWHADLSAKVKFPTGDEDRGLGTGEIDTYAQVDFYRSNNGVTPFLNGGYRWLGDGLYQLEDGFYASGGVAFSVGQESSVGASLDWRQAIVKGGDDSLETTAFYYRKLDDRWATTVYAQKGFSDASPDYGIGAQFSFGF